MMIILTSNNETDKIAAESLANSYGPIYDFSHEWKKFTGQTKDKCFIIDTRNEFGYATQLFPPELLASKLITYQLPDNVSDIYLLISENSEQFQSNYAHVLAKIFAKEYKRNFTIHTIASLNFDETIVKFIPNENKWKVNGKLPSEDNKKMSETLIWEGSDILEYMNSAQQTFTAKTYTWSD